MGEKRKRSDGPADGGKSKKTRPAKKEPEPLPVPIDEEEQAVEAGDDNANAEETQQTSRKTRSSTKKETKSPKAKAKTKNGDGDVAMNGADEAETKAEAKTDSKKSKKSSKSKKAGGEATEEPSSSQAEPTTTTTDTAAAAATEDPSKPLSKRAQKKARKEAAAAAAAANGDDANGTDKPSAKGARNIVFVGNLPFTANPATIRQHFANVKPTSVRCLTKDGKEDTCRGFAFIEFANPTHMRTCLDKMHHTVFNDGVSPARKINVELTAGGGGNKSNRTEKIKQRNAKLAENRTKRIEKENKEKKTNTTGEDTSASTEGVHPSRLAQMS